MGKSEIMAGTESETERAKPCTSTKKHGWMSACALVLVHIKLPQNAEPPSSTIVFGLAALNSLIYCLRRAEPPKHASDAEDVFKLPLASSTQVPPYESTGIAAPLQTPNKRNKLATKSTNNSALPFRSKRSYAPNVARVKNGNR